MSNPSSPPPYLFIFGAVGSGNTFMFSCITQDERVYGVNEDALGSTLERFIESESEMSKCPHSLDAFRQFLSALRKDRDTLVLKTPSNLRRIPILREHIESPQFIFMIREPHAAIVSGLARHKQPARQVAELWKADAELMLREFADDGIVVPYEDLAIDPKQVIDRIADRVMPLSDAVYSYATRVHYPERAQEDWWKSKVDDATCEEIIQVVKEMGLKNLHRSVLECGEGGSVSKVTASSVRRSSPISKIKKKFYQAWYRLTK